MLNFINICNHFDALNNY